MTKCNAPGCTSTENSEKNGKILTLFSFPEYDESLVKQWVENSRVNTEGNGDPTQLKLCELHFEATSFVSQENNALTPGAVPTIFEFSNKRKVKEEQKLDEAEEPPLKQNKLDDSEEKFISSNTAPESQEIQGESDAVINNSDIPSKDLSTRMNVTLENSGAKNCGGSGTPSVFTKQLDMGKKVYRLIIRIDKVVNKNEVREEPKVEPKQQPRQQSAVLKIPKQNENGLKNGEGEEALAAAGAAAGAGAGAGTETGPGPGPGAAAGTATGTRRGTVTGTGTGTGVGGAGGGGGGSGVVKLCSKTGCKLTKTTLNTKPVFKCERCNKFYVVKENKQDAKDVTCYICQEVLPDPDSLNFHLRKHFTCDMCNSQCTTQISFDKHIRLHVSTDPLLPYKCHKCSNTFEVKADVREHYQEKHSKIARHDMAKNKVLYRCEYCYAVFTKEEFYNNHVEKHMGEGEYDCSLCDKKFKTSKHLAIHRAKHSNTFKFTCKVCGKEFDSYEDIEIHMKTHIGHKLTDDEHKCNICRKLFKDETSLNNHMRGHLSRAHRCPLCKKAFINKTTLRIHFKTHNQVASTNPTNKESVTKKNHDCTLCTSKFDSRSQLYNHIMTHLEQMHGGDGSEAAFHGLDELLESDEDILS